LSRIEHIAVPVTKAKLIGEAWRMDVRTSPILSCSLCCANTIGAAIRAPLIGEAQQIKKICKNNLLALRISLPSPKGEESVPRFAYKRRAQRSTINVSCDVYIAQTLLALCRAPLCLFFQNSPVTLAVLTRNGNMVKSI
jgi:hypothetical protein